MESREFGQYRLLRKLSQGALLDTYRAGQREGQEVQRVVLLYSFNVEPEDTAWIVSTAQAGRRALHGLSAPSLGSAIDSGEVAGTAYLAYDYISGGTLRTLLDRSRTQGAPVSLGSALLITNRIAQALLAAWQHESRALHGFLVPEFVVLSTEGDVQLLGIEVASRLRRLLSRTDVHKETGAYLAPEVVPEGQAATTDDVYSLGALLYEMLTGRTPAQPAVESPEEVLDGIGLAQGGALPEPILDLMRWSLVPATRRTDLKTWQTALNQQVVSGEHKATAFDLALYLHTIFADELRADSAPEGDGDEMIQPVRDAQDDPAAGPQGVGDAPGAEEAEVEIRETASGDDALEGSFSESPLTEDAKEAGAGVEPFEPREFDPEPVSKASGNRRWAAIAAGIAVLAVASWGSYTLMTGEDATEPVQTASRDFQPANLPAGVAPPTETHAEAVRTAEQPAAQQRQASTDDRTPSSQPSEAPSRRRQTPPSPPPSERIEAQTAPAATESPTGSSGDDGATIEPRTSAKPSDASEPDSAGLEVQAEPRDVVDEQQSEQSSVALTGLTVETGPDDTESIENSDLTTPQPLAVRAAEEPEPQSIDAPNSETGDSDENATQTRGEKTIAGSQRIVADQKPEPPTPREPVAAKPSMQTEAAPEPEQVREGDLVTPAADVTPPRVVSTVRPVYPMRARRLRRTAVIPIHVLVDETGAVIEVEPPETEAGFGFDEAALAAARQTTWKPATKDGVAVKMWVTVRIEFIP